MGRDELIEHLSRTFSEALPRGQEVACLAVATEAASMQFREGSRAARVIRRVAQYYSLTVEQLLRGGRAANLAYPRQILMWVLRQQKGTGGRTLSYPGIGRAMGGMDHSTIFHGMAKVQSTPSMLSEAQGVVGYVEKLEGT